MRIFSYMEKNPYKTLAITDSGKQILYREVLDLSAEWEEKLGHRLAFLLCRNTPGSLLCYLSFLKAGCVSVLLDAEIAPALLQNLLAAYHPAFLALPEDLPEETLSVLPKETALLRSLYDYRVCATGEEGPELAEELRLLLTTSGSTGSPKLVRLSGENLDSNAESIAEYLQIDETERPITMLPMSYSYGMSIINSHVLKGAPILLTGYTIMEQGFWKRVVEEGATSLVGVPYTYQMFNRLRLTTMDLPALHYMTQAGGKLPPEIHRQYAEWCAKTGKRFYVMYGQTEASPRMGYLPPERSLEKCGSMGIAVPGGTLYLADVDGKRITEPETVGELVYEGPNVSLGYAVKPEDLLLGDENHGVLVTGDMAKVDADGFFTIVGRKKRFIKILGKRVNLDEAERLLNAQFPGTSFACAGEDEQMKVYAEAGGEPHADLTACATWLALTTGLPEKSIHIEPIAKIPRSESGKIRYAEL